MYQYSKNPNFSKCSKCSSTIPAYSKKCPICRHDKNCFSKRPSPAYDKYQNKVEMLTIDYNKNRARMKYINENFIKKSTFEKTVNAENTPKNHPLSTLLIILFTCLCIFVFVILLKTMSQFSFGIVFFSELLIIITGVFTVKKLNEKHRIRHTKICAILSETEEFKKETIDDNMYSAKAEYYFSDAVIGYSVFDHSEVIEDENEFRSEYKAYAHYELDKNLIKEVKYNSKYAGYELWTTVPTYDDTDDGPKDYWFFPDIFDDNDLTLAVGKNLPPKQIYF